MATIDKNSITAIKSGNNVFRVEFDFTDSTTLDPNQGWLATWLHTNFFAASTVTVSEFNAAGIEAMKLARRPTDEINFETDIKSKYGIVVVRSNPVVSTEFQKFELAAISSGVVMKVAT
jgi:hypothetical protein